LTTTSPVKAQPTVEEIIALLKKTALPTVVCEGSDDLIIYRRLEDRLSHLGVSVLPAGGRKNVLQIFDRRSEIPTAVQVVFLADQDIWVNKGIPLTYSSSVLLFTDGYSIENDIYCDGNLEGLLAGAEVARFQRELNDFVEWYALALARHLNDPTRPIAMHPHQVLDPALRPKLLALEPGELYPVTTRLALLSDYKRLIRGKSLLGLLTRNTNSRPGQPNHTEKALLEMVAARPGPNLVRLSAAIEGLFASQSFMAIQRHRK
jgi:hypothetical protein